MHFHYAAVFELELADVADVVAADALKSYCSLLHVELERHSADKVIGWVAPAAAN